MKKAIFLLLSLIIIIIFISIIKNNRQQSFIVDEICAFAELAPPINHTSLPDEIKRNRTKQWNELYLDLKTRHPGEYNSHIILLESVNKIYNDEIKGDFNKLRDITIEYADKNKLKLSQFRNPSKA